jgi:hypothetical protein
MKRFIEHVALPGALILWVSMVAVLVYVWWTGW